MISLVAWSKDRAMQMDLLLQSVKKFCGGLFTEIIVHYKASNASYIQGYNKLAIKWPQVQFVKEADFYQDVLSIIKGMKNKYSCAICDDCIFFRDISHLGPEIDSIMNNGVVSPKDVICVSFGIGKDSVWCAPGGVPIKQPPFKIKGNLMTWCWKDCERPLNEFSHPFMFAGHVYFRDDHYSYLARTLFTNPSTMEMTLQNTWEETRRNIEPVNYMACPINQSLVHSHNNRVQKVFRNANGIEFPFGAKMLNDLYLSGEVIDLDAIPFIGINGLHKEVNFFFRKEVI